MNPQEPGQSQIKGETASQDEDKAFKHFMREKALRYRRRLTPRVRSWKDQRITDRILNHPAVTDAEVICLYASLSEEVATWSLMEACLARGQRLLLPRVEADTLVLHEILNPKKDLTRKGSYQIKEPGDHCPVVAPREVDAFLVPGVAFSIYGHRLGFGGGYYDRLLPQRRQDCFIAGLAYECQVFRGLPFNPEHDFLIETIFTEENTYLHRQSPLKVTSEADTHQLAMQFAEKASHRLRLGLIGELGVGKSTFIRGMLRKLGVMESITSPTFVLMNEYEGRIPIRHMDLYRLGKHPLPEEDLQMFLETLNSFQGMVLLEWADFAFDWLPLYTPLVQMEFLKEDERLISLDTFIQDDLYLHDIFSCIG